MRMRLVLGTAVFVGAIGSATDNAMAAEQWPTKPIRWICPYVAGGAADIFSRTIGQKLGEAFGQTIIIDNRAGANGSIGTELAARAPADGYTILMGQSGPLATNPAFYKKLNYDPVKDFTPVTQGTLYMYVLVVTVNNPVNNIKDMIEIGRAHV